MGGIGVVFFVGQALFIAVIILIALKIMCMNIGLIIEPLFSYAYPKHIDSMKSAGQWVRFACIEAKMMDVHIMASHAGCFTRM
jgi:hypothetical protein